MRRHLKFTDAFKLLLPSWNFFADFDAVPRLEIQLNDQAEGRGEWIDLFPSTPEPGILRVFLNPAGNRLLLEQSQLDRAADFFDSSDAKADCDSKLADRSPEQALDHQLMLIGISRSRIRELGLCRVGSDTGHFSFRLSLLDASGRSREVFAGGPIPMQDLEVPNAP